MSRCNKLLFSLVIGLLSLFINVSSFAQGTGDTTTTTTTVEKHTIVNPAPQSSKCTTVKGHWEGDVWVDTQTVCTYENRAEGVAWIQDYWACTAFTGDGNCTNWEYRPGHWVKTLP